jgi:Domain of unknown function (DUF5122) beta-propeller
LLPSVSVGGYLASWREPVSYYQTHYPAQLGSETNEANSVRTLLASETKVYLGGFFTMIDGQGRRNLAALDLDGDLDPTWKPEADSQVLSLAFSCDKETVFADRKFSNTAGSNGVYSPRERLACFATTSGSLHPWAVSAGSIPNEEGVADLAVTCERITAGFLGRNYVRSFRLDNGNTGTRVWENKCAGDVQTLTMLGPEKVIIGGHFSQVAGIKRIRIAQLNLSDSPMGPSTPIGQAPSRYSY